MKYKAVIIEDEMLNREFLSKLIRDFCPDLELVGTAAGVTDGIMLIEKSKPAIIFLDIELQGGTAFDILGQMAASPAKIIFTTAFDHYAIKAIRCSAVDYILKPISLEELHQAVARTIALLEKKQEQPNIELLLKNMKRSPGEDLSIGLSTLDGTEYIPLNQIIRLEAKGPYTTFFLRNGSQIMVSKNLKEYEMLLTEHGFFRLHNSYMVNMREVKKVVKTDGGYAVLKDDSTVAISPRKKDEFNALMAQRLV
ncbi:MAG: response regulator transcription factor [Chitinophagaceae bacterium]|nr:MAG: response regulator transcription factor [Chitinophagaceae bacterium]